MIKQNELRQIDKVRHNIEQMKQDLAVLEAEERVLEAALITRVEGGEKQERGKMQAGVQTKPVFERVSWKEVVARRCGPKAIDEEMAKRQSADKKELIVIAGNTVK